VSAGFELADLNAAMVVNEYFKERWWGTLIYGLLDSEWRSMSSNS
jgi:hypothetical protein